MGLVSPIPTLPNPSAILIVEPEAAPTSAGSDAIATANGYDAECCLPIRL